MVTKILAPACLVFFGLFAGSAWASGDLGCAPVWALRHVQLDDCSNTAFLSPGNDSQINLEMLMLDRRAPTAAPAGPSAAAQQVLFTLGEFGDAVDEVVFGKPAEGTLADAAARSDLADGEGSRCVSDPSGATGFVAAVNATPGLSDAERAALVASRRGLAPSCTGGAAARVAAASPAIRSAVGKLFAIYLAGAASFYDGDFDAAHARFAALADSRPPWIREAARYMLGRVELNRAQINAFDQFGNRPAPEKVDRKSLAAAETAFQAYLRDYPDGEYADSARGLLRRIAWLGGDAGRLGAEYARLIDQAVWTTPDSTPSRLAREIDHKLLEDADPAAIKPPVLLAAVILTRMRGVDSPDPSLPPPAPPPSTLADLEARRPLFARDPALFDYLLAAQHFYVEKDPAGTLAVLQAEPPGAPGGYLGFSRRVLRGLALEALHDKAARAYWTGLYPAAHLPGEAGAVELALAMNHEREGDLAPIFATGSIIQDANIRSLVLLHDAGAPLLRARAQATDARDDERRLALYVLLYKDLTRGRYADFLEDMALLPRALPARPKDEVAAPPYDPDLFAWSGSGPGAEPAYPCPALREVAGALSRRPSEAHARLCLAEFIRESDLDGSELNTPEPAGQLGGVASQFAGASAPRLDIYQAVIADPKAPVADRSYALYRAVNCYAPSGYNHCDGAGVSKSQRREWFRTLKSTYAATPWADALKYYW